MIKEGEPKLPQGEGGPDSSAPEGAELKPDNIREITAALTARLQKAQEDKERDIKERLEERLVLIKDGQRLQELSLETEATIDYFETINKGGELEKKEQEQLVQLQELLVATKKQILTIEERLTQIESRPEILEKVQEEAEKEHTGIKAKEIVGRAHEKFDPQIDHLAKELETLAGRIEGVERDIERTDKELKLQWHAMGEVLERAIRLVGGKPFWGILERAFTENSKSFKDRLTKAREGLGLFQGKEKAAVDLLLEKNKALFAKIETLEKQHADLEAKLRDLWQKDFEELKNQLKAILIGAWDFEEEAKELSGRFMSLPSDLWRHGLSAHLEKVVDVKRFERQGDKSVEVGEYEGWYKASQASRFNGILSRMHSELDYYVLSVGLYTNPREKLKEA